MADGHREDLYMTKEQRYLGDDHFVERVTRTIESDDPRTVRIKLEEIEKIVCRQYDLSVEILQSRSKEHSGSFGRAVVAHLAQELGGIKLNEVANRYGRDQVSLSLGLKRLRGRTGQEAQLRRSLDNLGGLIRKGRGRNK